MRNILPQFLCLTACGLTFVTGCQTNDHSSASSATPPAQAATPSSVSSAAAPTASAMPAQSADGIIRIKAGQTMPYTDSSGHVWQAEQGFTGGDSVERDPNLEIANTKDPAMFRNEHYSMDSFSISVPNGKYTANLYFAETFDGVTGPGQRVFSFNAQGHEFKDFDIFVKAGGSNRVLVETIPVEVTNGKFKITFTSNVENPEINAIELIPQH
jgi:hypothetical protein